jgi:hypothetical protein
MKASIPGLGKEFPETYDAASKDQVWENNQTRSARFG